MTPPGLEEMSSQLESLFRGVSPQRNRRRRLKVREARKLVLEEEAAKLIDEDELKVAAVAAAEQQGIVFIDEIDKITRRSDAMGADVSREGVQRDLLPLVEGCTVSTKYGTVRTDHMLFIASGAFHVAKPSDLIPELQGRFPIRVELDALTADDFVRILTEPDSSLCEQYVALLGTEGFELQFAAGRRAPPRRHRLPGEPAHREHRRTAPAHGARASARGAFIHGRRSRQPGA